MKVRLKHRRLALELARSSLSLNRWAQKMGLSSGHLSDLVNGKRLRPRPRTRQRILKTLGLTFGELFEIEYDDRPPETGEASKRANSRPAGPPRRRRLGLSTLTQEYLQRSKGELMLANLLQDVRFALRQFTRRPGFAAVAVATLTIGITSSTALFSVINSILWKPFPYQESDRLVDVYQSSRGRTGGNLSFPDFWDLKERHRVFSQVAAHDWEPYSLTSATGEAARIGGARVSADLLPMLGLKPLLGRTFTPEEDRPGGDPVIVLGERAWRTHFGADPDIVGKEVLVNSQPRVVVGVMPQEAEHPEFADLWVPLARDPLESHRGNHWLQVTARLKPGVSLQQARSAVEIIGQDLQKEYPDTNQDRAFGLMTLRDEKVGDFGGITLSLLAVAAFVLLIACGNVANLLLARSVSREREIAIRSALGAGRGALVRQLMVESFLLAGAGALLGLLLGRWASGALLGLVPIEVPGWVSIAVDVRVLIFVCVACIASAVMFGIAPALQAGRAQAGSSLREGGGHSKMLLGRRRLRGVLVVGEVALSLVLLVGAGLMFQHLLAVSSKDPGFRIEGVLTAGMDMLAHYDKTDEERVAVFERFLERLEALPGIEAVGAVDRMPLKGRVNQTVISAEGQSVDDARRNPFVIYQTISSGYFRAMGIDLMQGSTFPGSGVEHLDTAIVSQRLADVYWPDEESVIGKRIKFGSPDSEGDWMRVQAVARDVRYSSLESDVAPMIYLPYHRFPLGRMTWALRTSGDPLSVAQPLRAVIREVDRNQPLHEVMTLDEVVGRSLWIWRFFGMLFWIFAGVALALALLGIYGVMAYSVSEQAQEMGIRMALGARRRQVVGFVLRRGMTLVLIGLGVGLLLGLGMGQLLAAVLSGVKSFEPWTFLLVSLLLVLTALLAVLLPARRASKVDPMTALRCE